MVNEFKKIWLFLVTLHPFHQTQNIEIRRQLFGHAIVDFSFYVSSVRQGKTFHTLEYHVPTAFQAVHRLVLCDMTCRLAI
jgi:hypothetical protein